jgi:ribonuclease BN (tRNA processing enzyme)
MPTPLSSTALQQKIRQALAGAAGLDLANPAVLEQYVARLPFTVQQTVGGNTPCLEVRADDQLLIIDAGSGLRLLGQQLMRHSSAVGRQQADFLITHTHWDHIQGFPFFQPVFISCNHFVIYSPFPDLADRLDQQQHPNFFPVPLSYMQATLEFRQIEADEWHQIGNFRVYPLRLSHPGLTYGYRIEAGHSCLVIATDSEYQRLDPASTERYVEFFRGADLLVFDAQYSLNDVLDKLDWGHSTAIMGAELAHRAGVKRLALFHHDPTSSDDDIWNAKEQAEAYLLHRHPNQCEIMIAYDGLSLEI